MHKQYRLFLVLFLLLTNIYAQTPIYVDEFNSAVNKVVSVPSGFSTSLVNDNLQISGNGNGAKWVAISYDLHVNGVANTIDISNSPKLFVRAKASPNLEFRVDLKDQKGYFTNQNPTSVNLDSDYAIYEFDFTNKLFDGAFGGTCTSAPCALDATKIKSLSFFAKPSIGGYVGKIDIDWITLGSVLPIRNEGVSNINIRYNQVGYFDGREKTISINSLENFSSLNYTIKNENGVIVKTGITSKVNFWEDAQEYVSVIDFTEIDTEGQYTIDVEGAQETFKIGNDVYNDLSLASLKYFYYNRASTAITSANGGIWARASGLSDTQVKVHSSAASSARPTNTIISAPKGWFDAGDYNKYVVNSGISTYTLLAAFEHYKSYYETKTLNIPESGNNLPDILDEIIWNLDWMLAMQDPNDGGVYHKLTGLNFSGRIMPDKYTANRYVVKKSTAAALNFAAVTAQASRVFNDYKNEKPGYSSLLLNASKDAYAWAKANPILYFTNPQDVKTGEYGDRNLTDEFQWAASELFITTKDNQYKNDINLNAINNRVPSWQNVASLALLSLNHHSVSITTDINVASLKATLLNTANDIKFRVDNSAMNIGMANNDYVWGSNGVAANQIMYLIRAYEISNDKTYLKAAYKAMDYLLGRNGLGLTFVSGFGDKRILNPHHRISDADRVAAPIPGMLAGGPQPGQQDNCTSYPSNVAARSFSDTWCSYATNEVTINWNAPLAYVTNALRFYQNNNVALSLQNNRNIESIVEIYPNPVESQLYFYFLNNNIKEIRIFSVTGKQIFKTNKFLKNSKLDFTNLKKGVYFIRVISQKGSVTKKIIKK